MNGKEILNAVLRNEGCTISEFAAEIGMTGRQSQVLYNIQAGKIASITKRVAAMIVAHKPVYNMAWLMTGEGDMLCVRKPAAAAKSAQAEEGSMPKDYLTTLNTILSLCNAKEKENAKLSSAITDTIGKTTEAAVAAKETAGRTETLLETLNAKMDQLNHNMLVLIDMMAGMAPQKRAAS